MGEPNAEEDKDGNGEESSSYIVNMYASTNFPANLEIAPSLMPKLQMALSDVTFQTTSSRCAKFEALG